MKSVTSGCTEAGTQVQKYVYDGLGRRVKVEGTASSRWTVSIVSGMDLLEFCRTRGILLEAYSPLTRGQRLNDPRFVAIAARYGRSPAQILLRWALEHGVVPIPKSSRPERIRENATVFDFSLAPADVKALDALSTGSSPR